MFRSDYQPKSAQPRENGEQAETSSDNLASLRLFEQGETLFCEGDRGAEAYVIKSGRVVISRMENGQSLEFDSSGPNSIIGEMTIISDMQRVATATAAEDTVCVALSRAVLHHLLDAADIETRTVIEFMVDFIRDADAGSAFDEDTARRNHKILVTLLETPETAERFDRLEPFFALLCRTLAERAAGARIPDRSSQP